MSGSKQKCCKVSHLSFCISIMSYHKKKVKNGKSNQTSWRYKKKVRWVLTVLEGPTWPSSLMIALAPANHYECGGSCNSAANCVDLIKELQMKIGKNGKEMWNMQKFLEKACNTVATIATTPSPDSFPHDISECCRASKQLGCTEGQGCTLNPTL